MATKWIGEGSINNKGYKNQILHYVYNGNQVLTPTAVNLSTGEITVSETLTADIYRVSAHYNASVLANPNAITSSTMPKELAGASNLYGTKLTANSIKMGSITTYANAGDITKWHIEGQSAITINNIFQPNKKYKIRINAINPLYLVELGTNCVSTWNVNNVTAWWGNWTGSSSGIMTIASGYSNIHAVYELNIDNRTNGFTVDAVSSGYGYNQTTLSNWSGRSGMEYNVYPMVNFSITCGRDAIGNGTIIDIYEVGWF